MKHKQLRLGIIAVCLTVCLPALFGCRQEGDGRVSANGSAIDAEAQKAAQRFADATFVKCGGASYATDGGQIWELRDMKVVAQPQDPQIAEDHKQDRKRKGIDLFGEIYFDCSSGRIYNYGWMNWPRGQCGYSTVQLVHQKGLWLYVMGSTLEELQKTTKRVSCDRIPR